MQVRLEGKFWESRSWALGAVESFFKDAMPGSRIHKPCPRIRARAQDSSAVEEGEGRGGESEERGGERGEERRGGESERRGGEREEERRGGER
eukprot:3438714-Rhodomonas_salina.1